MIKTLSTLREQFWNQHLEFILDYRVKKRQNDYNTDIRCAWVDHVDYMRKNNQISEKLANRATL